MKKAQQNKVMVESDRMPQKIFLTATVPHQVFQFLEEQ
jgi:hypothetical protein